MADKTLSQVIGGSAYEIGDIIETQATSLTDGRVLLDCDASVISAVTYPDLAALLPNNVSFSWPAARISTDGSSFQARTGASPPEWNYPSTAGNRITGMCIAGGGTRTIAADAAADIWIQDNAGCSEVQTVSGAAQGNPVSSSDGSDMFMPYVTSLAAADLYIFYTITSGDPTTSLLITSAGAFDGGGGPCAMINAAGTLGKIVAWETTGSTIDTWTSGGTDIATGWTETSSVSWATAQDTHDINFAYSDDLQTIAIPRSTNGLIISTNGGTTWTQDVMINEIDPPNSVAVSTNDTIFATVGATATNCEVLYSTTDSGTTWNKALTLEDMIPLLPPQYETCEPVRVENDRAGRIYFFVSLFTTTLNSNSSKVAKTPIDGVFFSQDNGTTWGFTVVPPLEVWGPDYQIRNLHDDWTLAISADDAKFFITGDISSDSFFAESALTFGKVLPYRPGYKIVADAP